MWGRLKLAQPFLLFGASVVFSRAMAFVTIPLTTGRLGPSDYGRLELISSIVEAAGIVLTLGLADSLFRFAAIGDEQRRRSVAAGLTGLALALALAIGLLLQAGVWSLAPSFGLEAVQRPLAIGLASASLSGLIELPLAYLRLRGRALSFLAFTAGRSMLQVAMMFFTLNAGYGVEGLLAGNGLVDLLIVAVLLVLQIRDVGLRFDSELFGCALRYNLPLIGGSLAMFALGSCDRWFLAGVVEPATLGFYGLAVKLAMIVPLAMQPFGLWWYARRIAVLRAPGGVEASAHGVAVGVIMLGFGAATVCAVGPLLIRWLAPAPFMAALAFLPWLALAAALNELCSLVNVGAYAEHNAFRVLAVNAVGAAIALAGYALLTPTHGVWGAIAATIAGHVARLALYLAHGRRSAPISYPWRLVGLLAALVALLTIGLHLAPTPLAAAGLIALGLGAFALIAMPVLRRSGAGLLAGQV